MLKRPRRSKPISGKVPVAILATALTFLALLGVSQLLASLKLQRQVPALLSEYSHALSSGQITCETCYSPPMKDLIRERRSFYREYFEVGLCSTLDSIGSEFISSPGSGALILPLPGGRLSVKMKETVALRGRPSYSVEESPLIRAARWALLRTGDQAAIQELEKMIQQATADISKAREEGFESTDVLDHDLVIAADNGKPLIVRDSFANRTESGSSPGPDSIAWADGRYMRRNKPDFENMPDYQRCHAPVEELGARLLEKVLHK
jgi:hypothetical protein